MLRPLQKVEEEEEVVVKQLAVILAVSSISTLKVVEESIEYGHAIVMIQEGRTIMQQGKIVRPEQGVVDTTATHPLPLMIRHHIITGRGKG